MSRDICILYRMGWLGKPFPVAVTFILFNLSSSGEMNHFHDLWLNIKEIRDIKML